VNLFPIRSATSDRDRQPAAPPTRPWLAELEGRVAQTLSDKPTVPTFGGKDPALAKDAFIARWQKEFPDATLIELHDAGLHIQEDAPVEIATAIRSKYST